MTPPESLAEAWSLYRKAVLHPDAPVRQVDDMRMSFYAGAQVIVSELAKIQEPGVTEREGVRRLNALNDELRDFQRKFEMKHRDALEGKGR